MNTKRLKQDLNAKIAILGDFIQKTAKELDDAMSEQRELLDQLRELEQHENN